MTNAPTKITLHKKSQILEVEFGERSYRLPAEYLRVHSPSAEVKGHGPGQEVLQLNKQDVQITNIEAQGNYAIRISFDDGHNSGLFTWEYLAQLGENQLSNMQSYRQRVEEQGAEEQRAEEQRAEKHQDQDGQTAIRWVQPK